MSKQINEGSEVNLNKFLWVWNPTVCVLADRISKLEFGIDQSFVVAARQLRDSYPLGVMRY